MGRPVSSITTTAPTPCSRMLALATARVSVGAAVNAGRLMMSAIVLVTDPSTIVAPCRPRSTVRTPRAALIDSLRSYRSGPDRGTAQHRITSP